MYCTYCTVGSYNLFLLTDSVLTSSSRFLVLHGYLSLEWCCLVSFFLRSAIVLDHNKPTNSEDFIPATVVSCVCVCVCVCLCVCVFVHICVCICVCA